MFAKKSKNLDLIIFERPKRISGKIEPKTPQATTLGNKKLILLKITKAGKQQRAVSIAANLKKDFLSRPPSP